MGRVDWIGLRPATGSPMDQVTEAQIDSEHGLIGDRHAGAAGHPRQITLFQMEHLGVVSSLLGGRQVKPEMTRRNIGVSGVNLQSFENKDFTIGEVVLHSTGPCRPCEQMNQTLGEGGLVAMTGHGGITARVVTGGRIRIGDEVREGNG